MIFQSIKTTQLTQNTIREILTLKDFHWKFGMKSQTKWYKKFTMPNDFHNIMIINKKVVGYTCLGERTFEIIDSLKNKKRLNYILLTTFILNQKLRNFFYASKMMTFNNKVILKNNKSSFLLCHDDIINFYKFFGWCEIKKSYFKVPDHESKLQGMTYNFEEYIKKKESFFNFYYYS